MAMWPGWATAPRWRSPTRSPPGSDRRPQRNAQGHARPIRTSLRLRPLVRKDNAMADDATTLELSRTELRAVAGYAVACARPALAIFERKRPDDPCPRAAIDAAQAFAEGAERTKALRDCAWSAQRAAQEVRDAGQAAASEAARAVLAAA